MKSNENWKVYPTEVLDEIAKKHHIKIEDLMYMLATDTLPDDIEEELEGKQV